MNQFFGDFDHLINPTPLRVAVELHDYLISSTSLETRRMLVGALLKAGVDPSVPTVRKTTLMNGTATTVIEAATPAEALANKDAVFSTDHSVVAVQLFFAQAEKMIIDKKSDDEIKAILQKANRAHPEEVRKYFDKIPAPAYADRQYQGNQYLLNTQQADRMRELLQPLACKSKLTHSL